jgi:UPF0755 protein
MVFAWLEGRHRSLQAGDYHFELPMTPREVLAALQRGTFQRRFTVPEGWTTRQIAQALKREGWIEDEQDGATSSPGRSVRKSSASELPPDRRAIAFRTPTSSRRARRPKKFTPDAAAFRPGLVADWTMRAATSRRERLTPAEVVTLASMIQREARGTQEMPAIAAVYLNRLRIRMRLQCCATVHYALGEVWDRPLRNEDLKIDSPFNTYVHYGLPPSPIGNPGREALAAVLRAGGHEFLYYVYRGTGRTSLRKPTASTWRRRGGFGRSTPTRRFSAGGLAGAEAGSAEPAEES